MHTKMPAQGASCVSKDDLKLLGQESCGSGLARKKPR